PVALAEPVPEMVDRVAHGLRAMRAAGEDGLHLGVERAPVVLPPEAVERGEHHAYAPDAGDRRERLDGVEHERLTGNGEVLLGYGIPHARALARRGHDGQGFWHGV